MTPISHSDVSVEEDAKKLADHLQVSGVRIVENDISYSHMGELIGNAILQQRRRYEDFVVPRLARIRAAWPEATTTTAFLLRLNQGAFPEVANVRGRRPLYVRNLTEFLQLEGIETPEQLRTVFDSDDRSDFLDRLLRVTGVGPKTRDYLAILAGSKDYVAVDTRLRSQARAAGITDLSYEHLVSVAKLTARMLNCELGDLDHALWSGPKLTS